MRAKRESGGFAALTALAVPQNVWLLQMDARAFGAPLYFDEVGMLVRNGF